MVLSALLFRDVPPCSCLTYVEESAFGTLFLTLTRGFSFAYLATHTQILFDELSKDTSFNDIYSVSIHN